MFHSAYAHINGEPLEWIKTAHAKEWKKIEVNLQKRPAIFLFHKELAI